MRRRAGGWRRPGLVLALGLLVPAAFPAPDAAAARKLPPQGVYDGCSPHKSPDRCLSRMRRLGAAGFRVVENAGPLIDGSASDILGYADMAHAQGLKVIWPLHVVGFRHSSPSGDDRLTALPRLAATCGCHDNAGLLAYLIGLLRSHPGTWGYNLADEPQPKDHDEVADFNRRVKALDPTHQRLIMGCGLCFGGEASVSFLADIDGATLGTDSYPVKEQAPDQPVVSRRVGADAAGLRRVADRAGRQTVVALQAWRWGDSYWDSKAPGMVPERTRFPTRREIEMQRNAAITGGHPDLIMWFTFTQVIGWEPGQRPWYWAQPEDPDRRWANLVGGAFAPFPNKRPVARFRLHARAARTTLDGARSYDPDGRIVRYRWYASGGRRPVCKRRRCSVRLRRARRRAIKLVVTDSDGASASRVRRLRRPAPRRG